MAVRNRDELLEAIRNRVGDSTDDETIAFLEDITDTLDDYESKTKGDGEDWKSKYEENDRTWRQKYTDRFFSKTDETEVVETVTENVTESESPKSFEDLFEVKED